MSYTRDPFDTDYGPADVEPYKSSLDYLGDLEEQMEVTC